jgi:hypothetical protein
LVSTVVFAATAFAALAEVTTLRFAFVLDTCKPSSCGLHGRHRRAEQSTQPACFSREALLVEMKTLAVRPTAPLPHSMTII